MNWNDLVNYWKWEIKGVAEVCKVELTDNELSMLANGFLENDDVWMLINDELQYLILALDRHKKEKIAIQ